jgi:hypothetical protein
VVSQVQPGQRSLLHFLAGTDWPRWGHHEVEQAPSRPRVPVPRAAFRRPSAGGAWTVARPSRGRTGSHHMRVFSRCRLRLDQESNSPSPRAAGHCPGSAEASTHGYWHGLYLRRFLRILSSWDYQDKTASQLRWSACGPKGAPRARVRPCPVFVPSPPPGADSWTRSSGVSHRPELPTGLSF